MVADIAPLLFNGGSAAEYEIFTASNGALMTRHIASGAVRLSVRSVEPLKRGAQILSGLPGTFPGNAQQLLSKLPEKFAAKLPSKVPGGPKAVAAVAGATVVAAAGYAGYEAWRNRRENERLRAEVAELHRLEGEQSDDLRASVREDPQVDGRWEAVSQAWDALLGQVGDRRELAEKLLAEARDFLSALAEEVEGDSRGQVASAPYLYLARIAAAQAWAAQDEPELAASEVRALRRELTEIGREEFADLRLLDPHAHDDEVTMLWGLHAQAGDLLQRVEDGTADLTVPMVPVPEAPVLAGIEDLMSEEGLALDLPIPVESVAELLAVRRIGAELSGPTGLRVPTVRSALTSLGLTEATGLERTIAKDVLMAVLGDEQGGMGAARDDFGLSEELVYPEPAELAPVELDWDEVIDRETSAAATETAHGRADDAVARLETLLFYLDELVRNAHPDVYRDRVNGVRTQLTEIQGMQGKLR